MTKERIDFETFTPSQVIDEIRADVETKGSLNITELANAAVPQSGFLTAIEEVVGSSPFAFVMKRPYDDTIGEVVVELNPALLLAALPEQYSSKIRAMATLIQRNEPKASNPEFQAFKRAICGELVKAILVESKGSTALEWNENYGTDFKFCHAHTSEAKKAAYQEAQAAREDRKASGSQLTGLRNRWRRPGK